MGKHISIKRRLELFLGCVLITVIYLLIGAWVMKAYELHHEHEVIKDTQNEIRLINISTGHQDHLQDTGVCDFSATLHWTFTGAMFYCLTVITTIGYGSFAPKTLSGRLFTGVYALLGISIIGQLLGSCAVLLKGIVQGTVQRIRDGVRHVDERTVEERGDDWEAFFEEISSSGGMVDIRGFAKCIEHLTHHPPDEVVISHVMDEVDPGGTGQLSTAGVVRAVAVFYQVESQLPKHVSRLEAALALGTCVGWMIIWAGVFARIEGWTYSEGLWFCGVTITTIGFGDFTPDTDLGRGLAFFFIVPGLGFGATALGTLWEVFESRRFWWLQRQYGKGNVSGKLLEAHGITLRLALRKRKKNIGRFLFSRGSVGDEDLANLGQRSLSATIEADSTIKAARKGALDSPSNTFTSIDTALLPATQRAERAERAGRNRSGRSGPPGRPPRRRSQPPVLDLTEDPPSRFRSPEPAAEDSGGSDRERPPRFHSRRSPSNSPAGVRSPLAYRRADSAEPLSPVPKAGRGAPRRRSQLTGQQSWPAPQSRTPRSVPRNSPERRRSSSDQQSVGRLRQLSSLSAAAGAPAAGSSPDAPPASPPQVERGSA
eukprot:TRINITY_DN5950_c0_g3_i1.p1 TRINITY_DN5950_c0_g3~~TRINITY_DN5950_c0_g3_i1.p1  ORF type:complete len:599 (+),score=149.03 TRINITY_DN5950_c0_g3_i1:89-1885(+)